MKRYSARQIRRTLGMYVTRTAEFCLGAGIRLKLEEVEDAYSLLDHMIERKRLPVHYDRFPYWAEIWPASLALARWFCQAESLTPCLRTLELGCGVGLVGIALARLGWHVEATDFVEDALVFATHNAGLNQVVGRHRVGYLDWTNPVGSPCECMVASDVVYEKKNHPHLVRVLHKRLQPGGHFYLSDPQRPAARQFVQLLRERRYEHRSEVLILPWESKEHPIDIHIFRRPVP